MIEEVSTEKLQKRRQFIHVITAVFVGVALVWVGLILWDLSSGRKVELQTYSGLAAPLAMIWLPILMLKKVNRELERRRE